MASVWETRFAQLVRSIAALREGTSLELLPDLMPVLPILAPDAPELQYLRRERPFAITVTQAAGGAGQNSGVILQNNSSNVLAVVERYRAIQGTGLFVATFQASVGGATNTGKSTEGRGGIPGSIAAPQSQCKWLAGTAPGSDGSFFWRWTLADQRDGPAVILPPGCQLKVQDETANTALTVAFSWYERTVDVAELVQAGA